MIIQQKVRKAYAPLAALFILSLGVWPLKGSELIQYARAFSVTDITGTAVQGTVDVPSTLASFTVQSSLITGLRIRVDPHGTDPGLPEPFQEHKDFFQLRIYRDGIKVRDFLLGDFGQLDGNLQPVIPHITIDSANFPEGFQSGSVYTVVGAYGTNIPLHTKPVFTSVALNWEVQNGNDTLMKSYESQYASYPPDIVENLQDLSFFHGNPSDISLTWIDDGVGYQPYPDANSQSIATNYGIPLHFDLTQPASAASLNYLTATLYQDDGDQVFGDNDTPVDSITYGVFGEESFTLPMFNRSDSNFNGWHFLKVQVTNLFGISQETVVAIASMRALVMPGKARWALHFPDTIVHQVPNGDNFDMVTYQPCSVENLETTLDGANPFTVRYVRPVYDSCNEGSQAVELDLNGWYDNQGAFVPLREQDDWGLSFRWLVGERSSDCNPGENKLRTPNSAIYDPAWGLRTRLDCFEKNLCGGQRLLWETDDDAGFQGGNFVEVGLTQLRDLRSSNAVGQVPGYLNAWYQAPPRQRLRLNRGAFNNELCDNLVRIGFKDSGSGHPIFDISYTEEGSEFLQHYQFDAGIQVDRVAVRGQTFNGQPVALEISDHPLAQSPPLAGVDYPFGFNLGDNPGLAEGFWLYFEAMAGNDITGINALLVRYDGTSGGGSSGSGGETEPGDREIESLTAIQTQAYSILADGSVQFHFELRHSPAPVTYVDWRWKREINGATEYWKEQGNWTTSVRPLHRIGEAGAFSSRWHIETNADNDLTVIDTDLPFQDLGPFFGSLEDQAQIYVEVKLGYQDTSSVDYDSQADGVVYPFMRELPDTTVAQVEVGLTDFYDDNFHYDSGRAADLQIRVTKGQGGLTANTLRFRVKDSQGTSSPFNPTAFAEVTENETHITAQGITDPALLALLDAPGQMELQAHPHGGTSDGKKIELFVRDPAKSLTIRYHFRDHLGSSATTQTFRTVPVEPDASESAVAFQLAGIRFYNQGASTTLYEPFGERFGEDVSGFDSEERPRYTGHEWDDITGFNYMKGRFQLTGRFNRPDPMRDWDWQNPHSINLYQYVRNDPISGYDPDGFGLITKGLKLAKIGFKAAWRLSKGQKAFDRAELASDFVDSVKDIRTIANAASGEASGFDAGLAVFSLGTELLPISISDIKGATRAFKKFRKPKKVEKSACFVAGTLIPTKDGLVSIENINSGDFVLSRNDKTGEMAYKQVLNTVVTHPTTLMHIFYKINGKVEKLIATQDHPFWVVKEKRWVEADDLRPGDRFSIADNRNGDAIVFELHQELAKENTPFLTYNFLVESFHTYFVLPAGIEIESQAIWVHNTNCPKNEDTTTNQGPNRAEKKGGPNSIYEQVDDQGNVRSRVFYDENGRPFSRQDFDHSHGNMKPHEHNRDFHSDGRPKSKEEVNPLPEGYDNQPSNKRKPRHDE